MNLKCMKIGNKSEKFKVWMPRIKTKLNQSQSDCFCHKTMKILYIFGSLKHSVFLL